MPRSRYAAQSKRKSERRKNTHEAYRYSKPFVQDISVENRPQSSKRTIRIIAPEQRDVALPVNEAKAIDKPTNWWEDQEQIQEYGEKLQEILNILRESNKKYEARKKYRGY